MGCVPNYLKFILIAQIFLIENTCVAEPNVFSELIAKQKSVTIDISELIRFYETLSIDEKDEQIRDWALYGLLAKLNISQRSVSELLQGTMPMRYPYLKNAVNNEISPGRIKYITEKDCLVLLPEDKLEDRSLIGSVVDKKYSRNNYLPELIHIFGYRTDLSAGLSNLSAGAIIVSYSRTTLSNRLWTAEYNYVEKTVRNLEDFKYFIDNIDDVTKVQWYEKSIVFGGRKYPDDSMRSLTLEDIAVLYKAYNVVVIPEKEENNVGFSLDPGFDYNGISEDLMKLSNKDVSFVDIVSTAKSVKRQQSLEPVLVLLRRYNNSQNSQEKRFCDILKQIEMNNSYQSARYDGRLQGTSPGMILFYTDLTAKLWALDYNGVAPKDKIRGFRTMSEIKVSKLYWDDFLRLSKTRLWFGLRQEGFDVHGRKILFEPTATRVYAASSDPLFPGKETEPNFQSREFLSWWDRHYSAISECEPQYHKLNQIQKWSCIMVILREEKSHILDFLHRVPVTEGYDFETWYKNTEYLKCKTDIPFLERHRYHRRTECLRLMRSLDYLLMGQHFFLYGGVSLASKKDIIQKLRKKTTTIAQTTKKGLTSKTATLTEKTIKPGKTVEFTTNQTKLKLNCKLNNLDYGNLLAEKHENSVKLKWNKNEGALINEQLNKFVEVQQSRQTGYKDERIFRALPGIESVIRVEEWKTYLLKTGEIKTKWVYLSINEKGKTSGYPAKAAGTEPDSDIFYGKLITGEQLNKIVQGKNTVKIF